jgi:TatD DNase family protein
MLLETDAPYLTPSAKRDTMNEPANLRLVAEYVSKKQGIPVDRVAKTTTNNTVELFGLR